ncbi:MAG: hypothetical protein MI757_08370 [Pirellulales bacterium]|nr:hypothetical protein [Pirellulales bacterium]
MKFTVIWLKPAEARLAELWLAADDRDAITAAAREIDRFLKDHPHAVGVSRFEETRILIVAPLCAVYRVYEDDRIVHVATVWKFPSQ